jgi:hypothetical protein
MIRKKQREAYSSNPMSVIIGMAHNARERNKDNKNTTTHQTSGCANKNAICHNKRKKMTDEGDDEAQLQAALALSMAENNTGEKRSTEQKDTKETVSAEETITSTIQNTLQPATNTTPNETYMVALTSMGFPEADCRKALNATNNIGVEAATSWYAFHLTFLWSKY